MTFTEAVKALNDGKCTEFECDGITFIIIVGNKKHGNKRRLVNRNADPYLPVDFYLRDDFRLSRGHFEDTEPVAFHGIPGGA